MHFCPLNLFARLVKFIPIWVTTTIFFSYKLLRELINTYSTSVYKVLYKMQDDSETEPCAVYSFLFVHLLYFDQSTLFKI